MTIIPAPEGFAARTPYAMDFVPSEAVSRRSLEPAEPPAIGMIGGRESLSTHIGEPPGLESLAGHVTHEIHDAIRVAPLVVVPGDELEEVAVQLDRAARVVDARCLVVDEVARDDLFVGVREDALQIGLARLPHGSVDFFQARRLRGLEREVDH